MCQQTDGEGCRFSEVKEFYELASKFDVVQMGFWWQPRTTDVSVYANILPRLTHASDIALCHHEHVRVCKQWALPS